MTFTCDKKTHTISLKGSVSLQAGLPSPAHPLSLPMTVTSAELSGTSSAFGKVMASLDGTPIGELVKQGVATPFPARHDLPLKLNITFERAACGGGANAAQSSMRRAAESLVLTTKDPAKLIGTLTTFRPRAACTNCKTPST
ncbi:hypothetical protein [Nonomuraea aurantiaca]|uniref:hypothetical protein n=1 Tax=Nonomuraea aurantiaca TaxID=2878562 RepID=UPI001CD96712|nr:hypothetical protein [Nonomuraea aurantiaca]MCA2228835.1 hypothetical protein [Nonomuraea aurantiaca]